MNLIILLLLVSIPVFSDYTYLDYDKLVFGNGGGLQLVSTDNESYFLQVLDIGSSDYVSKGFNIDGKFKSITPTTANAYIISDFLAFDLQDTFVTENLPSVNGSPYIGINTMEPAEAITVSGDLRINGNIAITNPIGIFETSVISLGTIFDTNSVAVNQLLSEYEFTCPPYVTHNIMVMSVISGKTAQTTGAQFWAYCLLKYKDSDGNWQEYDDPTPGTVTEEIGLRGIKYGGYFNDQFTGDLNFFKTALIESDPRSDNLFTAINTTTPGENYDSTYSVRFYGYFLVSESKTYTFQTRSDDSSWLWVGEKDETLIELEGRRSVNN